LAARESRPLPPPESVLAGAWRLSLSQHGVKVSKSPPPSPASLQARQAFPGIFSDLVGRQDEIDTVFSTLSAGSFVNVWGECGVGKTSLLRHVAYRAAQEFYGRQVVYHSAARLPLEDLLQALDRCLYEQQARVKWSPGELRERLARSQAVLVIDDIELADTDLADLLWAVRGSLVVIASTVRRSDRALRPIWLGGLKEEAAIGLFERGLGRRLLETGEYADVRRLVGLDLSRGHPLRILQAAALVGSGRRTTGELLRIVQSGDPAKRLTWECQSTLTPEERQVVAVLALAAGVFLPTGLISQMCGLGQIMTRLRRLQRQHLIDERPDQFGLPVCSIGDPRALAVPSARLGVALRGLETWLAGPDATFDGVLSISGSVLTILDFAAQAGEWDSVLRIVRAIEPVLIISGRWEQWLSVLQTGLHAAEQVHNDVERAYHLHELGSRAFCLGEQSQAKELLRRSKSLRSGEARRLTTHNLALCSPLPRWQKITSIAGAAVVLAVGGTAGATQLLNLPRPAPSLAPSSSPSPTPAHSSSPSPAPASSSSAVPPPASSSSHSSPSSSSTGPVQTSTSPTAVAPEVTAISPNYGSDLGGTSVTITGRGFTGAERVSFGTANATGMNIVSDTEITANSPAAACTAVNSLGACSVDVTVTNSVGTSATSTGDQYTYNYVVP